MSDYYMKTEHLAVGYQGTPLISDICLSIRKGEIVTLIGPNGAGKSTILKSITRQLKLISGSVYIAEEELQKITHKSLSTKMSVVLTERMKPEYMTCHDVVATGRYPYTGRLGILSKEDEEKVEDAMKRVHASELGNRDFNAISDGQRQRVLLARAICQEPEIIILDEPTSFLDIRHKLSLLSILRSMAKENHITVIMSLHEIDLAEKISDKIVCVKGDHIAHFGEPEEVFREENIQFLYEIDKGYFDPLFGSLELPKPEGEAHVMVLSSGGNGIPAYRKLQKQNRAFHAGILYANDMDYQVARLLASDVLCADPFEPVSPELIQRAKTLIDQMEEVWDAGVTLGSMNSGMKELLEYAKNSGKLKTL
ncbi:MAG: ABC transporter ATP-binding protein [Eubacteriales bacterium]|nr:ABC transporter ATP-binding protein [Eubacteriales bacterium]